MRAVKWWIGDSPELMPLELSLFSDLIEKVAYLMVVAGKLLEEEKFSMATQDKTWRTIVADWEQAPKGRIIADIERYEVVLESIITMLQWSLAGNAEAGAGRGLGEGQNPPGDYSSFEAGVEGGNGLLGVIYKRNG